ncbi:MAG: hypothetical protein HOI66_13255 [Verrucomicrobia bacterium]|nr:hypothetical protein [Verrucomicrobiota bacterium]
MSLRALVALFGLLVVLPVHGQVTVELEFGKDFYIADEPMFAKVKITNFSGRTLNFGKDNHWLMFSVEARDGFLVDEEGTPNVSGEFEIPNASRGSRRVNLAPYYKIKRPGRYHVVATVFSDQLKEVLRSPSIEVNIIRATTLWQKDFGVATGEENSYEVRRYSLIRALNDNVLELYIRVASRDDSRVFTVFSVGNLVSFGSPEAQIDRMSRLHLLQQYAARSFRYLVVTADGELMIRHRYDYTNTRPKLGAGTDNMIMVRGGIRVPAQTDLPPSLATFDRIDGGAPVSPVVPKPTASESVSNQASK